MAFLSYQCKIFLLVILIVFVHGIKAEDRGFLLVAPNTLHVNTIETVCVSFHNITENGNITVNLATGKSIIASTSASIILGRDACLQLLIPKTSMSTGNVGVEINFSSFQYRFQNGAIVTIKGDSVMTFIETDKKVYKHGQKVLFRIIRLTNNLLPLLEPVSEVWIENPSGVRLAQWKKPHIDSGLTDLSFELSDEPSLGEWSINLKSRSGNTKKQLFLVKEYVLPKFEVIITTTPSVLLFDFENISLRVCAHYTYGRPVHGKVSIEAKVNGKYALSSFFLSNTSFDLVRGCHEMVLFKNHFTRNYSTHRSQFWDYDFGPRDSVHTLWNSITYFAEVIENETEVRMKASKSQKIFKKRLQFEFRSKKYFKPNMPYYGKIAVQYRDGSPAVNQRMILKVISNGETLSENQHISNHFGEVDFVFTLMTSEAHSISLQESFGSRRSIINEDLRSWYSPSHSFLQIVPLSDRTLGCAGGNFNILINFMIVKDSLNEKTTFYYQILSRSRLMMQQKVTFDYNKMKHNWRLSNGLITGDVALPILLGPQMSPAANILVYFVTNDGEIVSDSQDIAMERCFENNVTLSFDEDEILPATTSVIEIKAHPRSLCGLSVVDKSAHLLSSTKFLSINEVYAAISNTYPKSATPSNFKRNCPDADYFDYAYDENILLDSTSAFNDVGLVTISNLDFKTAPCPENRLIFKSDGYDVFYDDVAVPASSSDKVDTSIQSPSANKPPNVINSAVEIRDYFPETWLWELHRIKRNGSIQLQRTIPHSITTWIGTAFCLSNTKGLGVSQQVSIRGFQAFFLSFTMPYSIKNEEVAPVIVTIFNYISSCIPVRIFIESSNKYTLVSNFSSTQVCLCDLPHTHKFWIRPSFIGNINVTVYAHSVNNNISKICKTKYEVANIIASDAATNLILVKAQGFPREFSNTSWICQRGHFEKPFSQKFDLILPRDVIRGSERASVSITGDLMGPTVQGLESLVKLPVGCGEQNMVLFAPNIYVLQYLTNSQQLTDELKEQAIDHLRTGYQRQLNYKHRDGSYSAFGEWDSSGSIWLTAFVLKSFAQAKPFVYIDLKELQNSEAFIYKKQLPDGRFKATGRVLSKAMQGGIGSESSDQSLAAYILIALLEAGSASNSARVNRTFDYLSSHDYKQDDTYLLAMKAYAAVLARRNVLAYIFLKQLNQRATREGNMLYWTRGNSQASHAMAIEITSYALLTLVTQNSENSKVDALSIVRWLTKQRNAYGGFVSTQDTILALQALAKYAGLVRVDNVSLEIKVDSVDMENLKLEVNNENKLVQQTKKIPVLPTHLDIDVTGEGCVLVQYAMKYNVLNNGPTDAFNLEVRVRSIPKTCSVKQLEICTSYKLDDGHSNMAVIEVQMISGFEADTGSLDVLQNSVEVQLKRWEVSPEGYINLYFEELTSVKKCFNFKIIEKFMVHESKPAVVRAYDYYEPELTVSENYSFSDEDSCGKGS